MLRPIWSISVSIYLLRLIHILPIWPFHRIKIILFIQPPCMGLSDLSGLFQYQINYPPPFFLWLYYLSPGLYGLRQININYIRLILYSLTYAVFSLLNCLYFLALLSSGRIHKTTIDPANHENI